MLPAQRPHKFTVGSQLPRDGTVVGHHPIEAPLLSLHLRQGGDAALRNFYPNLLVESLHITESIHNRPGAVLSPGLVASGSVQMDRPNYDRHSVVSRLFGSKACKVFGVVCRIAGWHDWRDYSKWNSKFRPILNAGFFRRRIKSSSSESAVTNRGMAIVESQWTVTISASC